jgi:hypothetical protein
MRASPDRDAPILLIEPDINAVTRRFGLPAVASYPPLAQVRLAGQIDDQGVGIVDLRIPRERKRFEGVVRSNPPALVGISLTFTSNGDEAIRVASVVRRASPHTVIVLGGTGASEDPARLTGRRFHRFHRRRVARLLAREIRRTGRKPATAPGFFHRADGWVLERAPRPLP